MFGAEKEAKNGGLIRTDSPNPLLDQLVNMEDN